MLWAPPAILLIAGWQYRWVADDGFIDMRIVQNLLHGFGPVFNAGERVEAYTSPAWVAIVAVVGGLAQLLPGAKPSLEWIAVLLGLGFSYAALAAAGHASLRLWRTADGAPELAPAFAPGARQGTTRRGTPGERWLAPLGALAISCIAPYWDFATSGLECGLVLGWLGLGFLGSTQLLAPGSVRSRLGLAALFGLGPLVRPDLTLTAAIWIGLLVATMEGWRGRAGALAAALALPAGYEIFRMGYFAATVPNTAIAKEASLTYWSQGIAYFLDFAGPYRLALGLPLLAAGLAILGRRLIDQSHWRAALIAAAPVVAGLVQGLFVVRVGGDFMHARMLLPPLFAISLPVSVLALDGTLELATGALAGAYALACLTLFRVPYDRWAKGGKGWIGNERGIYVQGAKNPNPVDLSDYREARWAQNGRKMADQAEKLSREGKIGLGMYSDSFKSEPKEASLPPEAAAPLVAFRPNVGEFSYAAGPLVYVCDPHGLPDPIGARLRLTKRAQPGHEKWAGPEWCVAHKLADGDSAGLAEAKVNAARAALDCGALLELLEAIDEPMTLKRFLRNIGEAPRLTTLRIPADPIEAEKEVCGRG
jgi:arabinofuranosyltransferase